jgi:hypothetical protein
MKGFSKIFALHRLHREIQRQNPAFALNLELGFICGHLRPSADEGLERIYRSTEYTDGC